MTNLGKELEIPRIPPTLREINTAIEKGIDAWGKDTTEDFPGYSWRAVPNGHINRPGLFEPSRLVALFELLVEDEKLMDPFIAAPAVETRQHTVSGQSLRTISFDVGGYPQTVEKFSEKLGLDTKDGSEIKTILESALSQDQIEAVAAVAFVPVNESLAPLFRINTYSSATDANPYLVMAIVKRQLNGLYISRTPITADPRFTTGEQSQGTYFQATGVAYMTQEEVWNRNIGPNSGDVTLLAVPIRRPQLKLAETPKFLLSSQTYGGSNTRGFTQVDISVSARQAAEYSVSRNWEPDPNRRTQLILTRVIGVHTEDGIPSLPPQEKAVRLLTSSTF